MKIYRLTNKGSLVGEYKTKIEALEAMNNTIDLANNQVVDQDDKMTPFDFELKAVEFVNESDYEGTIMPYWEARKCLGLKSMVDSALLENALKSNDLFSKRSNQIVQLMQELNPNRIKSLIALNRLLIIAEAQNKADGFVPDFSKAYQYKWFPWFKWSDKDSCFVYAHTSLTAWSMTAGLCSQICFKSPKRAADFGKKYAHLYNDVLLNEPT